MIELKHLGKIYSSASGSVEALKDVNLTIADGEIFGIIGLSGAGKSTLVRCINLLERPTSGEVLVDGQNIMTLSQKELLQVRRQIGMIFQGGALLDSSTVEENVRLPLDLFTNQSSKEKRDRVNFCLQRVNLKDVNDLYPAELSGGMIKRVAIARAIVMNPKYLFCDEPNSGLDPMTSVVIDNLIKEITEEYNITTIINTHDMNSVLEIGEHVLFIYKGEKWWEGNKHDILNSDNRELNEFVFASTMAKRAKACSGLHISGESGETAPG